MVYVKVLLNTLLISFISVLNLLPVFKIHLRSMACSGMRRITVVNSSGYNLFCIDAK